MSNAEPLVVSNAEPLVVSNAEPPVHILEMNGESYRFRDSIRRMGKKAPRQNPTGQPTLKPKKKEGGQKP